MGKEGGMRGRWRDGMDEGDGEVIMYKDVVQRFIFEGLNF